MADTINNNQGLDLENEGRFTPSLSHPKSIPGLDLVKGGTKKAFMISRFDDYKVVLEDDFSCDLLYLPDLSANTSRTSPGGVGRPRVEVELKGKNSRINIFMPVILAGSDELNIDLVCRHVGENSQAFVYLMAAVSDNAKLDFTGNLIVEPEARGSKTHLSGKAILLSNTARARILPALEIKSDDVEASHKATVGEVDLSQKFYLESRGIPAGKAENMIIHGYFDYIISALNDGDQKDYVKEYINNKLSLDG